MISDCNNVVKKSYADLIIWHEKQNRTIYKFDPKLNPYGKYNLQGIVVYLEVTAHVHGNYANYKKGAQCYNVN